MEITVEDYIKSLATTEKPYLILASVFKMLFKRELSQRDWGQLGRLINIYGRWRVLESFLKASVVEGFDPSGKNVWGYFSTICISSLEEDRKSEELLIKNRKIQEEMNEETMRLIRELSSYVPNTLVVKEKEWLISNSV